MIGTEVRPQALRRWVRAVFAVVLAVPLLSTVPTGAAAAVLPDGTTSELAAASCWEIKQNVPASPSGIYWLVTPKLQAPEQFYCDMTTDGGGWVLVGRGREGWRAYYGGLGTAAEVRNTVTGQAAFGVRQLPSATIDGLLNGGRVDALTDPIRVRRATNATGTSWQEARFRFVKRDRWVWTFPAEHAVGTWSFGGSTGSGGQTNNFGNDTSFRRIDTRFTEAQGWTWGWSYGSSVTGTNSASTYLWSNTNGLGSARPFAQVYLRPRLTLSSLTFPAVPDAGTPEQELAPLASSFPEATAWGVTGLANGIDGEMHTEVSAFTQVGNYVYVGGNFRYVQRDSAGAGQVEQPYLAAFNVNTREWVSSFRPQLNGQVKALAALPNGKLIVGGEFTTVNGSTRPSLASINPTTGATDTSWHVELENRLTGGVLQIRGLSVQGNWVYLAGAFTHVAGGSQSFASYARSGARVSVTNGTPDGNWNPNFNGTSVGIDASDAGDRTYFAGYFTVSNGLNAMKATSISTAAGAPLAGPWNFVGSSSDPAKNFQFVVHETGDRLWVGGSEHNVFSYDRDDFTRLTGNITKAGGDFQSMTSSPAGLLYAGCHCDDWNYSNAFTWSGIGTNWTQADKIGHVAAWNTSSGAVLPEFEPVIKGRRGYGAWAVFEDSTGRLWIGGDFVTALRSTGAVQWVGGFVQFPRRDSDAPTRPTGLTSTQVDADTYRLTWTGSTDNQGPVRYEVFQGNRVIATTTSPTLDVAAPTAPTRYAVRAADGANNRSASTQVLTIQPPDPGEEIVTLIAEGASWRWVYSSTALPANWKETTFDDSSWAQGNAVLGFGSAGLGTDVSVGVPSPRPLSAQFRRSITLTDPASVTEASITVPVDDGVVIYVNGTEVGRQNMPAGTLTQNSYATAAPRTSAAMANKVTFTVPPSLLRAGTNTVSASVHLNYRSTPDVSYDLKFMATTTGP
jgi:trimeric autotransporter adhesin